MKRFRKKSRTQLEHEIQFIRRHILFPHQHQFIGGNVFVTSWFAAALLLVMLLLYKSFAVLTGETDRRDAWQIATLLRTVILMMTGLLTFILPRYT